MIDQEKIHNQCLSDDSKERIKALKHLRSKFSRLPDKQQAWNDLIKLISDEDIYVRSKTASALGSAFFHMPDKKQAWNDLIILTNDKNSDVKYWASSILVPVISGVPDKKQAWTDLHRLTNDEESSVRYYAAYALGSLLSKVPDEQEAWSDLQQEVWSDLHKLINDHDSEIKRGAADAFCFAFCQVPDKQQAENDLYKLTIDGDSYVRRRAAIILGSSFYHILDKIQASKNLHRLTSDGNSYVRLLAADAIGSSFSYVQDKQQAWSDLIGLTTDGRSHVRTYANHSLGKVSIFKASQAEKEEDYKKELEKAIEFFEKAAQESGGDSPSQFCLPFYRSFYSIIFQKREKAKEEVDKYLAEAKDAVRGSKSKELLFEAVENLANALKEVHNLENIDLQAMKGELNFYRIYCDRAAELMNDTNKKAPSATEVLRKGLPILDRNLKGIIEEIQEKAKAACKEAKGTPAEYAACAVNDFARKLKIGSPEYLVVQIENLVFLLKSYIPKIEENNLILDRIDKILREEDVVIQYILLNSLIPQIINIQVSEKTNPILSEIKFLRVSVDRLVESIDELQNPQEYLEVIQQNLEVVKSEIPEMKEKINEVLSELYSPLSTDQKLKIAFPIIPALVSYEIETNVPKLVADKIDELKNLVLRFKKGK